jgi:polar amino acid transport system substrate-binding protein
MIEIAERAMARLGFRVDYQLMPWDRTMSEVRDGRIDGAVGATELEADGLQLSGPLGMDADCFFVSSTNPWRYGGPETLPRVLLGAVSGYVHDEGPVDAYIAANDVPYGRVSTSKGEQASANNVRLLFLGRIDAILDSKAVVALEAFRLGRQPDLVSAGCLEALPLYIAFSPKQKRAGEMIGAINDEVADLRRSGELTTMLARYGLEDWVK